MISVLIRPTGTNIILLFILILVIRSHGYKEALSEKHKPNLATAYSTRKQNQEEHVFSLIYVFAGSSNKILQYNYTCKQECLPLSPPLPPVQFCVGQGA